MAYPDALSNVPDAPAGTETLGGSTPTHSAAHQALADAVNETQATVGLNPEGDYATVAARLDALDLPVFDPVAYGAVVDGSTDDTTAWQAAIDAAGAAGGGVVRCSKAGVSVIGGALQDTGGANAQLTLPAVDYADSECVPIVICGPVPPAVVPSVIGSTPLPDRHLVLKSTLATGTGALLGAKGPAGTFGSFTNVHLTLADVSFRLPVNPTNSAVDLRRVATVDVRGVLVDASSFSVTSLTEPTTATSFALRLPTNDNGASVHCERTHVVGFYNGVEFSEHAILEGVTAWGCRVAFVPTAMNHAASLRRIMAVHCTTGIKPTGNCYLDVEQFDIEHATSGWTVTAYDVDDASNRLTGRVRWWAVLAGTGPHDSFTVNGGANLDEYRIGEEPAGGGGGSATYFYRDRLTAAAGNNTLTLGATQVTNSPLIWVNGAIKWPAVDYSFAGSVATFTTPLSGSDVVAVHYASAASSASASSLSTVSSLNISDDFNRADSTTTLGTTSVGAYTWSTSANPWGISANRAYLVSGGSTVNACWVDAGQADGTVSVTIAVTAGATQKFYGLWCRCDGTNSNGILVQVNQDSGQLSVERRTSGSNTTIGTAVSYVPTAGDVLSAELAGSSIVVKVNGVTKITTSDATYAANTRHGMWNYNATNAVRLDNFSIVG